MIAKQRKKFCDSAYVEESYKMRDGFVTLKYISLKRNSPQNDRRRQK